jgi:hypothetical protein
MHRSRTARPVKYRAKIELTVRPDRIGSERNEGELAHGSALSGTISRML